MAHEEPPGTPASAERPALEPIDEGLAIRGRIARADVAGLCDRARPILDQAEAEEVVCDVGEIVEPDVSTIDALARMQLAARRLGRTISVSQAPAELLDLLAFVGLREAVPLAEGRLRLEPRRKAEEREVALGVEEEADPGDLPI